MAQKVMELLGVSKIYNMGDSQVHALKGITLQISAGEMVSIMGPSGCGKSTLLHIAGCLDRPSSGVVRIGGQDVMSMDDSQLARIRNKHIGFVFQSFNLLPHENALNNVVVPIQYSGIPRKQGLEAAKMALQAVGLGDRMYHRPNELSGGQRQRVAIARAIVNQPSIVLADEPTGALDQKSGREIMGILQRLNSEGRTIVVVTHDREVARYAKRIVELSDGRIVADRNIDSVIVPRQELEVMDRDVYVPPGLQVCVKCNFANRPQARFCSNCGFPVSVSPGQSNTIIRRMLGMMIPCPFCATPNRPFAKYCMRCGGSMERAMAAV